MACGLKSSNTMAVVGEKYIMSAESGLYECKVIENPHVYKPKNCEYVEVNPHGTNVHRFFMYDLKRFEEFPEDVQSLEAYVTSIISINRKGKCLKK